MVAKQEILRTRRSYNQWVNNQTLEDYALRFTAKASRRWSLGRVANTALGAISFLALEAIGAAITLNYGFDNTVLAVIIVSTLIFFAGLPICYYAAKYGVDIDLLTRGAGFGYLGSTATSLIYSSFTFIFFALEAAIMAKALELVLGLPLAIGYIISSVIVIPLVFHGITFISRFQLWTQPLWIVLQLLPFILILYHDAKLLDDWYIFQGSKQEQQGTNLILIGSAASVMFALVAQIGEQVDFLRFMPEKSPQNKYRWWGALIMAGPGWVIVGAIKILAGSFLVVVAINYGIPILEAAEPTIMYSVAFSYVTPSPGTALALAGIFVVLSQLKINVTNAYAGSIAWSNFFSRLTHSHPGRVVWLVFNVAIALLLMELGIYQTFENTLSVYAIVAVSWVGTLVADLVINKPLRLSPKHIEFKRAHLHDINPVGIGSMMAASIIGIISYLGFFGEYMRALAHFVALGTTFLCVPLIAVLTKSKFYIARKPYEFSDKDTHVKCNLCENNFETEDIAHCPAYEGFICSLCCSLDSRCGDSCKKDQQLSKYLIEKLSRILPKPMLRYINFRFVHFVNLLIIIATITSFLLSLIYINIQTENAETNALIEKTLWDVFFILMIAAGVISWLLVLSHESRVVAQEESQIQTKRLVEEIAAHHKTDQQLQIAKETAESANNAKSRYLTGISHELRTPLNTVLGYAQLLEMDSSVPENIVGQIATIRRSGEHLADLIEGLLDISKIEAGRLDIQKNTIQMNELMNQFVNMFKVQAKEKGLDFTYERRSAIPENVIGDEKRVRQILINLLSNALKYTEKGEVRLSVSYRNQVAEFEVYDTGVGIPTDEFERIFKPFERVRRPDTPSVMGTGLGLTITRLLTDIMGGDINVRNNPDRGVTFTVKLALPTTMIKESRELKPRHIVGYEGERRSVMVVDDDAPNRGLLCDFLTPLGFAVIEAPDSATCLTMIQSFTPDIFFLDRLMPGMDGSQLAIEIRKREIYSPIVIISANAIEDGITEETSPAYDGYLLKPIKIQVLAQSLDKHLNLTWIKTEAKSEPSFNEATQGTYTGLSDTLYNELIENAEIGHLNGLNNILNTLKTDAKTDPRIISQLTQSINTMQFGELIQLVETMREHPND